MADYELREYRPGDEESILRCFNLVFARDNPDFVPRTMEQWDWTFRRNPAGRRVWLALTGGEVVAQYAALPNRVWIGGEERYYHRSRSAHAGRARAQLESSRLRRSRLRASSSVAGGRLSS